MKSVGLPLSVSAEYNLFVTSMPKAGTHLLCSIIERLWGKYPTSIKKSRLKDFLVFAQGVRELGLHGIAVTGHFRSGQITLPKWWRTLVLIRDPRDVLVSMRDYLSTSTNPSHAALFRSIRDLPKSEQYRQLLFGVKLASFSVQPLKEHCSGWIEWTKRGAQVIRYEDLLTGKAAGDIASFLVVEEAVVAAALAACVGNASRTLNVGRSERWKEELDEPVLLELRAQCARVIEKLGYRWD